MSHSAVFNRTVDDHVRYRPEAPALCPGKRQPWYVSLRISEKKTHEERARNVETVQHRTCSNGVCLLSMFLNDLTAARM